MSAMQVDKESNRQFRLHLHRGIGYLATPNTIRSVADLCPPTYRWKKN